MIEKFKGEEKWTAADVNKFMENLPRDMLFVLRTLNIVRSLNKSLGGSSRERFDAMSESMLKGLALGEHQRDARPIFCGKDAAGSQHACRFGCSASVNRG